MIDRAIGGLVPMVQDDLFHQSGRGKPREVQVGLHLFFIECRL